MHFTVYSRQLMWEGGAGGIQQVATAVYDDPLSS